MPQRSDRLDASKYLPLLLLLFAASGCSALIYETVWYQLLELAIGMTAVSLGFCWPLSWAASAGSPPAPTDKIHRNASPAPKGFIELDRLSAPSWSTLYPPLVNRIYIAGAEHGLPGALLRAFIAAVCPLPPTVLMGASLPAIIRWIKSTPHGVSWWGCLRRQHRGCGVCACSPASTCCAYIIAVDRHVHVAAGINVAVALAASPSLPGLPPKPTRPPMTHRRKRATDAPRDHAEVGPSNAIASPARRRSARKSSDAPARLSARAHRVRVLHHPRGLLLIGLGIGSTIGSSLARTIARPRAAFAWCQLFLCAAIAWSAHALTQSLPYWPINPSISTDPWWNFQLDVVRALWAVLPSAILWGASFPLAVAAVAGSGRDLGRDLGHNPGRIMGGIYAAKTGGAIVGALATSLVLVPWIGTHQTQRVLLCAAAVSGVIVLLPYVRASKSMGMAAGLAAAVMGAAWLSAAVQPVPGQLIAYGRRMALNVGKSELLYTIEGRNSSVAITKWNDG
jgi:spermidine synthase